MLATLSLAGSLYAAALTGTEDGGVKDGPIPFKRTEAVASASSVWRVVLSFGIAIAVGVGAIYLLKRYVPASLGRIAAKGGRINVLEIRRVTPRLTLFLVEVDGQSVLLTQSGGRVRQLRLRRPGPASTDSRHAPPV